MPKVGRQRSDLWSGIQPEWLTLDRPLWRSAAPARAADQGGMHGYFRTRRLDGRLVCTPKVLNQKMSAAGPADEPSLYSNAGSVAARNLSRRNQLKGLLLLWLCRAVSGVLKRNI